MNSAPLGSGTIDKVGLHSGFHALAAGSEVVSHYDQTMQQRFLFSGRVRYLPMSDVGDDRVVTSLLSGERHAVESRRFVDATHFAHAHPLDHSTDLRRRSGSDLYPARGLRSASTGTGHGRMAIPRRAVGPYRGAINDHD